MADPSGDPRKIKVLISSKMDRSGGALETTDGAVRLEFPFGALAASAEIKVSDATCIAPYGQFERSLLCLRVEISDADGKALHALSAPAKIKLRYDTETVRGIDQSTLRLYHWGSGSKAWEPLPTKHNLAKRTLEAETTSFSDIGMWGDPYQVVPASLKGFDTDLFTGSASLSIPLEVPPGPNGFQPSLALGYSSGRVNEMKSQYATGSWVGMGWSLSLGAVHFDTASEKCTLELNGVSEELYLVSGNVYRTAHETYLKVERNGTWPDDHWIVRDKSGTQYRFGYSDSSRQIHHIWDGIQYNRKVWRWDLDRIENRDGCAMEIVWQPVVASDCNGSAPPPNGVGYCVDYDQSAYPSEIRYCLNDAGSTYRRKIVFTVNTRNDTGFNLQVKETRKLSSVGMYADSGSGMNLVRRYDFEYQDTTSVLLLTKLKQMDKDLAKSLPAWTFTYDNTNKDIRYNDPYHPERYGSRNRFFLTSADNGQGGKVEFSYVEEPSDWAYWITWTRYSVSQRRVYNGLDASPATYNYAYEGFDNFHYDDDYAWERLEFRGHDRVTVTHPDGHVSQHHFYQGITKTHYLEDGGVLGSGLYTDNPADLAWSYMEGKEFESVTRSGNATSRTLARTYTVWRQSNGFVYPLSKRYYREEYDENGGRKVVRRGEGFTYDSYGNVYIRTEYGQTGAAYRKTVTDYACNTTNYIVDKPSFIKVWDMSSGTDVLKSRKALYYDNQALGTAPTVGHVSREDQGVVEEGIISRYFGYNRSGTWVGFPYGNTTWVKDANGNVTETQYDSNWHTLPVKVIDPLLRETTTQYHSVFMKPTLTTDPNASVVKHEYDSFGRVVKTWRPTDDNTSANAASIVYRYHTTIVPNHVAIGIRKDAGGGVWPRQRYRHVFYDGLGREVQRQEDFDTSSKRVQTSDINDLRTGVKAYNSGLTFTNDPVSSSIVFKGVHFNELRTALSNLYTSPPVAVTTLQDWSSGTAPASGTPAYLSDISDLRLWLNEYEVKRPATERSWSTDLAQMTIVNTHYDAQGRKSWDTMPHNLWLKVPGRFNLSDWNSTSNPRTQYTYDSLDRCTQVTAPGGELTRTLLLCETQGELITRHIDALNHTRDAFGDSFGRTIRIREYSGTYPYLSVYADTSYQYDVRDLLTQVTDTAGNVTKIEYNMLGRKKRMHDPDFCQGTSTSDPAYWWNYVYDANGNMTSQTDAKQQTMTFEYDALNRLRYRRNNGGTALTEFVYDETSGWFSGSKSLGRRTTVKFGSSLGNTVKSYYDAGGRVTKTQVYVDGSTYNVDSTYDALDRPLTVTYPNNEVVRYAYGDHGLPVALESSVKGPIVKSATYNALGKPYDVTLGNNLVTSARYWGTEYRPSGSENLHYGMVRSIATGSLQSLTYDYDQVGNVASLSDTRTGETVTFGFDEMNRLASSTMAGETFSFNSIGNLLNRGSTNYTYPSAGSPRPHAPLTVAGQTYSYDQNGNLTGAEGRAYVYDLENRLVQVTEGGTQREAMVYDGDGTLRVLSGASAVKRHYVAPGYQMEKPSGEAVVYYQFGGRVVAWRNSTSLRYVLTDHLASAHGEASEGGAESAQRRYAPFGSDRAVSGASDLSRDERYTSQKRIDNGNGNGRRELYHYCARWYLPGIGLFAQPDSIVPSAGNPQALNRYMYCLGNPMKYNDPTGHRWEEGTGLEGGQQDPPQYPEVDSWVVPYLESGLTSGEPTTEPNSPFVGADADSGVGPNLEAGTDVWAVGLDASIGGFGGGVGRSVYVGWDSQGDRTLLRCMAAGPDALPNAFVGPSYIKLNGTSTRSLLGDSTQQGFSGGNGLGGNLQWMSYPDPKRGGKTYHGLQMQIGASLGLPSVQQQQVTCEEIPVPSIDPHTWAWGPLVSPIYRRSNAY